MVQTTDRQRLAAILAADVAGFSRLMSATSAGPSRRWTPGNACSAPRSKPRRDGVIDMAGDSVLAVFDSAIGAVSSAVAVQRRLDEASSSVPEDRQMRYRMGIHLGDVIEKSDGTAYGDGVNIAARLQGFAEPGGIIELR